MKNDTYLYRGSLEYARRNNEVSLWRASHRANIACKKAIEESIRQGFDGMHLQEGCIQDVLEEYGFKRVNWVLANTVREKLWDGRFSRDNKEWACCQMIPPDPEHNCEFVVESHPAVLDGFLNEVRTAFRNLNLFGPEHCCPDSCAALDYEGKVLGKGAGPQRRCLKRVLLVSGEPALVCPRRIWLPSPCHWAVHPLYLLGRRRGDALEPFGFHRHSQG